MGAVGDPLSIELLAATARALTNATALNPPTSGVKATILLNEATSRLIHSQQHHSAAKQDADTNGQSSCFVLHKVRMNNSKGISLNYFNWPDPVAAVVTERLLNGETTTCNLKLTKLVIP